MTRFALAALLVGLLAAAGSAGGDKKAKGNEADGDWIVVGMEQDGKKVPAEAVKKLEMKLSIKGATYTLTMAGELADKGTSVIDATKKPYAVDIKPTMGPHQGKTMLAIVEIADNSMKACYDMEGKSRPTAFATKEGSGHVLILYQRAPKNKE